MMYAIIPAVVGVHGGGSAVASPVILPTHENHTVWHSQPHEVSYVYRRARTTSISSSFPPPSLSPSFRCDQAIAHARSTSINLFRPDHSTYHRVIYSNTGKVMAQDTVQGFASWSCWSRGQAWAIAGFTMMHR